MDDAEIAFDERGLVPCIAQDWRTGEVLTLAYMNAEALRRTRETGEIHFFSRSRQELWHKGGTSGNTQAVRAIRYDCDGDALVALVEPTGPACHTGERTCFHRGDLESWAPYETLPSLERTIASRAAARRSKLPQQPPTGPSSRSTSCTRTAPTAADALLALEPHLSSLYLL